MQNPEDTGNDTTKADVTGNEETGVSNPPIDTPDAPAESGGVTLEALVGGHAVHDTAALPLPTNLDGTPKRKRGRPRKVQGGEPPAINLGDSPAPVATPAPKRVISPNEKKANRLACDEMARQILNTVVGGMKTAVGPEWEFESAEEAQGMKAALSAYIEYKGGGEMTPDAAMALAALSYTAPRFAHKNTREKFGAFFGSVKRGFLALFGR